MHELNVGQLAHVAAFVFGGKDTDLNFIDLQWTIYQIQLNGLFASIEMQ